MIKDRLFNDTLEIEVDLIGYDRLGESIVFIIKSDGHDDFIGVVDSYCRKKLNKTIEIVKRTGKCDFLCWTHRHMDHSKGIAEVMQYCSDTSCIYITPAIYPHIISGDKTLNTEEKAVKKYLETVLTGNNKTGPRVFRVADAKLLYKIFYRSNDRRYAISISSFCPNDNQLIQHDFRGTKNDDNIIVNVLTDNK